MEQSAMQKGKKAGRQEYGYAGMPEYLADAERILTISAAKAHEDGKSMSSSVDGFSFTRRPFCLKMIKEEGEFKKQRLTFQLSRCFLS